MLLKPLVNVAAAHCARGLLVAALFLSTSGFVKPADAAVLLHEYTFTGGVTDSVGSINGTLIGGASVAGGVLTLDGVDDYVQLSGFAIPTGAFSVSFDAKLIGSTTGLFREIISQGSSGQPGFYIGTNTSGQFRLGDQFLGTGVNYPTDGQLHSFLLTSGGSGTNFYIDSLLVFSSLTTVTVPTTGTATRLGRQFDPMWLNEYFRGELDNVRIYSGELSVSEVPLPAALPLFATGLGLLGLFGWHRKRKAALAGV